MYRSSNWRELANLVMRIEVMEQEGEFQKGHEIWIFTDNMVTEAHYYKGASKGSKDLHSLIQRLREVEMKGRLFVHMVWISGKRMIAQGTDGISRGDYTSGVLVGKKYLSFIPLNKRPVSRASYLKTCLIQVFCI
mmetsp:Transcript_12347/g.17587  ORF Transcript_12347/g.17587 Transcript_12347/m.17587 type:complete len:135 (+) Transcript_12347:3574-3978(+)